MVWLTTATGDRIKPGMFVTEVKYFAPLTPPSPNHGSVSFKDLVGPEPTIRMLLDSFTPFHKSDTLLIQFLHKGFQWTLTAPVVVHVGAGMSSGVGDDRMLLIDWVELQLRAPISSEPYTFQQERLETEDDR